MNIGDPVFNKETGLTGKIVGIYDQFIRVEYSGFRDGRTYIECVNLPIIQTDGVVLL